MTTLLRLILMASLVSGAQAAEVRTLTFSLRNERATPLDEVVSVSLPVPAGLIPGEPPQFVSQAGERTAAQADVITRHTDGSVRRMKVSFRTRLGAKSQGDFTCESSAGTTRGPALAKIDGKTANIHTDAFELQLRNDDLHLVGKNGMATWRYPRLRSAPCRSP